MFVESDLAAKTIAGEITLADNCAGSMKRWRQIFGIKQAELAKRLKLSPSVISDYESGRRSSPGTHFVKRYVQTLIEYDREHGSQVLSKFTSPSMPNAILCIKEFKAPVDAQEFINLVDGEILANKRLTTSQKIMGYTVVDSIQAILTFTAAEFQTIYGSNTERALVFTKVKMGRSPLIAVKVTALKPGLIVLHGLKPEDVDELALHIAEKEKIPLVVSKTSTEEELIGKIKRMMT
jgi:putative transcriptional regulator